MTEPRRWVSSSDVPEELRQFLREAQGSTPLPQAVRRRVLKRVSRLAPVFTVFGLSLKAAATTFAASALVSSAAIVSVQHWQAQPTSPPASESTSQGRPGSSSGRAASSADGGTLAESAPEAFAPFSQSESPSPAPEAESPAALPASSVAAGRGAPSAELAPPDPLVRETQLLDQARASLQASPARALALVRRHARDFPGGQLRAERMFIEAQALAGVGRSAEARHRAQQALRQYPGGLYAERVRAFLDEVR